MATSLAYGTITISDLADGAQIWTTNETPSISNNQYVFTISQLVGDGNADVKVGDLVFNGEYRYTIISVGDTAVTTDYRTSLKGIQGEQGYSLRGSYIRDKWTNAQWTGTYGVIGYTASFSNYDILSSGNQTNGKYTIKNWSVGDIFFLTGTATDTGIAYTATYTVTSKPTSNTGTVTSSCIAFAHAEKGKDGRSIISVVSTNNSEDGGTSTITITYSDNTTSTFTVKNGEKGNPGSSSQWYFGTALTHTTGTATLPTSSTSGVIVGSMYLNSQTSLVYKCTAISGTTATWTYAGDLTKGVIDNISIGGRNLIRRTDFSVYGNNNNFNNTANATFSADKITVTSAGEVYHKTYSLQALDTVIPSGTAIICSVYVYAQTFTTGNHKLYVSPLKSNSSVHWVNTKLVPTGTIGRFTWTYTLTEDAYGFVFEIDTRDATDSGQFIVGRPKAEIGNKATDWTPAPEDVKAAISTAQTTADNALTSANGKNKVYHQATKPSGGTYVEGDTWFDSDDGYKMYTWNGSSWTAEQLGENALADLSITNAKIANGTIDNAKIATLDAGKITTGTLDAQRIAANSITLGQLNSNVQNTLVEYIQGTQTAKTGSWTGNTRQTSLVAGKMIAYRLPYAGNGNATLNLTLATSPATTTGAKAVYLNTTRVTTHFGAGAVINMTYDGSAWRASSIPNTNTNYYDRENYKAALYASEAIATDKIAVLGTDGKLKVLSNSAFDMTGPILYVATAYTATDVSTPTARTTNYSFWGTAFNLTTTHAIVGAAAGKPVYIVGTMQGTTFTPNSSVLTCTIPNQENDLYYIKLGLMSTATTAVLESQHPLYAYYNGAFQRVDYGAQTKATEVNRTAENALNNAQDAQDAADNALAAASANTSRIKTNESKIETLEGSTGTLSSAVAALNEIIGSNDNQGLRKRQKEADELLTLLQAEIGAFNSWLEFKANSEDPNDKTGLIIGKTGESGVYVVQIEGDAISFYENREAARTNDTERRVAFFQNHYLYVDNAKVGGNMEIGNFRFITQANGNMSLVYIGGSE